MANTGANEGPKNIMLKVEVRLSAMPLCGRNKVLYKEIHIEASAFRKMFYNIYGKMCGILEKVPRFLKNVLHIPEGRHLGLAYLRVSAIKLLS